MRKDEWIEREHAKNMKTFIELARRFATGLLKIISIQIETTHFGNSRVVIFFKEEQES